MPSAAPTPVDSRSRQPSATPSLGNSSILGKPVSLVDHFNYPPQACIIDRKNQGSYGNYDIFLIPKMVRDPIPRPVEKLLNLPSLEEGVKMVQQWQEAAAVAAKETGLKARKSSNQDMVGALRRRCVWPQPVFTP